MKRGLAFALASLALGTAAPVAAQLTRPTSSAFMPAASYAAPDDALAMSANPASLAALDGWSLAYVGTFSLDDAGSERRLANRGDGFYAAVPLPFGLAIGAGIDAIRPARQDGELDAGRTIASLGLALRLDDRFSIGASLRYLFASSLFGELVSLDLAATYRPSAHLALALLARDVNGPRSAIGTIDRSLGVSAALRPDATRAFTIDGAAFVSERGALGLRAAAEIELPSFGRALAGVELERVLDDTRDVRGMAGLAIDVDRIGVGTGVVFGNELDRSPAIYATARVEEHARRGLREGDRLLELEVSGGERAILRTLRSLERATTEPGIAGVLLIMRGGVGLADAQELRLATSELEARGRHVICSLADASGSELYACANASRIAVDPAGGIRAYGPSVEVPHLGGFLERLGIRADFVRVGRYKSAIEQFQGRGMTAGAREEREEMLDGLAARFYGELAHDRHVDPDVLRGEIDRGPYVAREALELGWVDALAGTDDLGDVITDVFGTSVPRMRSFPREVERAFADRPHVGVVVIDGDMVDGENTDIPLLEIHTTGGRTASRAIDGLAADPNIGAIVLRIDTGGGSVLAADQIHRAIVRARRRGIPVIASLGTIAASGGYYVAAACDEIWADPSTLTGSIGVWFGKVDFAPLLSELGVETEQLSRGAHAGAESLFRPFTADERAVLADKVRRWYRDFVARVAEGRAMRPSAVHAIAQGRVFTGDRALENGLVDRLGGFTSALARARELGDLDASVPVVIAPHRPATLLDYVLGDLPWGAASVGGSLDTSLEGSTPSIDAGGSLALGGLADALHALSPELFSVVRTVAVMRLMGDGEPMAYLPMMGEQVYVP